MKPDEIIARLTTNVPESGYDHEDIANLIKLFQQSNSDYTSLTENSQVRFAQLEAEKNAANEEILRLKAKNYDLLMKSPGAETSSPDDKKTDDGPQIAGVESLFEEK